MKNHFVPRHKAQQAEPQNPSVEINGKNVPLFGNLDNNDLAVVDLNVLTRLAAMLPKANIVEIIDNMIENLNLLKDSHYQQNGKNADKTVAAYTETLESELRFHRTVNQIKLFIMEETADKLIDQDQVVS